MILASGEAGPMCVARLDLPPPALGQPAVTWLRPMKPVSLKKEVRQAGFLQCAAARLPSEVGGIALNCAGLAAWSGAVSATNGAVWTSEYNEFARWVPLSGTLLLLLLSAIKLCVAPDVVKSELCVPKSCGSYGGLLMASVM